MPHLTLEYTDNLADVVAGRGLFCSFMPSLSRSEVGEIQLDDALRPVSS